MKLLISCEEVNKCLEALQQLYSDENATKAQEHNVLKYNMNYTYVRILCTYIQWELFTYIQFLMGLFCDGGDVGIPVV